MVDPADSRSSKEAEQTAEFTTKRTKTGSRGLQIRCPHCSNPVELLADTPYEEISCGSCGSMFSLIDREQQTRHTTALQRLGRFELISRLGVGGFGTVWKARDTELDRTVAIKIPRKGQLAPAETEQFFREARAAAQLRHRNIVPVHEVGRHEDSIFIVSDMVRGVDLSDWIAVKSLGAREATELCKTVSLALHHAHEHGVIHRDLKPSNIMMDEEGEPNLMDFGLAKRDVAEITMTIDGQILGTPAYMSPEQARGDSHWTDRRTDLYSLGVILFRLLTGELPFRGEVQMQIHQRLTQDAPDPRKLNRHIPKDLSTICLKCLERDANRRYTSAQALAEEFDRFLQGRPILARPISRAARVARWAKRQPAMAIAAALTLLLAVGGPLAAIMIENQRQRLEQLVGEKNNLIERYADEEQKSVAEAATLRNKLAIWEGRANPWELWPAASTEGPRRLLLRQLYETTPPPAAAQLNPVEQACNNIALAMLADDARDQKSARRYWAAAALVLEKLSQENRGDVALVLSLADCHRQLARLAASDPDQSRKHLEQAAELLEARLAGGADATTQAALLEVKMDQAVLAGFENAGELLTRAAKLQRDVVQQSSASVPIDLYRLVCFLSGRPAVLSGDTSPVETSRSAGEAKAARVDAAN